MEDGTRLNIHKLRYGASTIKNYKGFIIQFDEFCKAKRKRYDFGDIDLKFYDDFVAYFTAKDYSVNTIGRHVKELKIIMRAAREEGLHDNGTIESRKFRVLTAEVENIYLTDSEIKAMAGYGLQRGIDGSVARHISTQEFYRNAIAGQKNLQDNIDELLRIEEQMRQTVERLKQQEQEARTGYEQAEAMRKHKTAELEATEHELKAVKGELKTEKLKSAAAEVGSNIVEGIGSLVGTSKVKRQEQQIGALRQEVAAHEETIEILQTQMQTMQADHSRRLLEVQQKSQQTIGKLQGEIDRIYHWLPDTPQLIKWGEYCRSLGFSDGQARDLVNMKTVRFSGELYSHEHSQHFEVENSEARLMRDEKGSGGFQLFIDRIPILRWFRQKAKEFLEHIGIKDQKQGQQMKIGR